MPDSLLVWERGPVSPKKVKSALLLGAYSANIDKNSVDTLCKETMGTASFRALRGIAIEPSPIEWRGKKHKSSPPQSGRCNL
jgi:hypothetical protein